MNQIKKLARRGTLRTVGLLSAIFLGIGAIFALIMLGEGKEEAAMSAVMLIVMFGMIMLIFVLVGGVPYLRVGKMVKRQCEELGVELNEEEDFEMITKEISKSKNWLVSGIYGSNFALHRRSIDHVEETSYYQKGRTYPMILLFVGPKKKYKIICSRKGDFERITEALDAWFPPVEAAENTTADMDYAMDSNPAEDDRQARRDRILRQQQGQSGKKTIAAIAGVVGLVIAFSVIYNLLPPRNAAAKPMTDNLVNPQKTNRGERQVDAYIASIQDDQFQQIAKGLIVETDGDEDAVEPFILSEENNQTQFAVYNDTEYFFYGQMVVYDSNQKTLGTLEIPLTKPYSYAFVDGVIVGEASSYEYKTAEFYSLSYAATTAGYSYIPNADDMTDWVDIVLESQDLTEANVQEISQAQYCSDVIARYASEELYFYDQNDLRYINDDENEGLDRACAKYRAVLDIDRGVIEWYSINNGSESAMPSIKMK